MDHLTTDCPSRETASSKVTAFFDYTTAHGFGRMLTARGLVWRVYWVLMCLAAYGVFIWEGSMLVQMYRERPVKTRTQLRHSQKLDFPVVTVCNMNILRSSKLPQELTGTLAAILNRTNSKMRRRKTNKGSLQALPDPDELHADTVKVLLMENAIAENQGVELERAGHQLKDMVLLCIYNGIDCRDFEYPDPSWSHIWNDHLGNCYMFNSGKTNDGSDVELFTSSLPGETNGLTIHLNIEQYEYMDRITSAAGVKVFIGDQGSMPFPHLQGVRVMPGQSTGIQMTKLQTFRLDPFHNNSCKKSTTLEPDNIYRIYNMSYSKLACKYSCLSTRELRACGCTQYAPIPDQPSCQALNLSTVKCLNRVFDDFQSGSCEKICPPPCSEISFGLTISSAKWPAKSYKNELIRRLESQHNLTMSAEDVDENMAELHVYFADLDYVTVQEIEAYRFPNLLSDFGGQMGMWIGVSALTIAEVLELACILIKNLVKKYYKAHRQTSTVQELSSKRNTEL